MEGLKLLLVGEQGLGDEFMFANILPDIARDLGPDGKLQIAVDPRLVSLFQRSFPDAEVGTYDDRTLIDNDGNKALRLIPFASDGNEPDMWAPMGTALHVYRKQLSDFRHEAFLVGFSDTIILQSAVLGLALVAALFVRKTSDAPAGGGAH